MAESRVKAARTGLGNSGLAATAHDQQLGMNLSDGQLLAVLQHQESPTRFVDVTEDPLVALYFAAEHDDATDGRIFVIVFRDKAGDRRAPESTAGATNSSAWLSLGSGQQTPLPWPSTTTAKNASSNWTTAIHLVDAGALDPRMSAQSGIFMVGGLPRAYETHNHYWSQGRRNLRADEIAQVTTVSVQMRTGDRSRATRGFRAICRTVRVPADLKPGIRSLLNLEGIGEASVYPDYAGFKRLAFEQVRRESG